MRFHAVKVRKNWASDAFLTLVIPLWIADGSVAVEPALPEKLEPNYVSTVQPLLARYCHKCHGAETTEADLDLAALATWADAKRHADSWQKVKEMIDGELMPPEDADQPTPEEREKLATWVNDFLTLAATASAGDPGPVVIRRLSNAEYTYTLRDLTGVQSLDPAREFPVDGAAGEGFTNTGNALVMSPALVTKYLDAAKEVARHAVLLPDGIRFSPNSTSRDWTDDLLAEIRAFYAQFTEAGGDHLVAQQGVPLDIGLGGRIPLEKYFAATIAERDTLSSGSKSMDDVALGRGLSAKYLNTLWTSLNAEKPSLLLDNLRMKWRAAKPGDEAKLAADVAIWQKGLFTFAGVGLIGRVGGPKQWLEPVSPLATQHEVRLKLPETPPGDDVIVSLIASDAGDGNQQDIIVWRQPRLVAPGRPDLFLRDVPRVVQALETQLQHMLPRVSAYLLAADEVISSEGPVDVAAMADKHGVDVKNLRNWLTYLGVGSAPAQIEGVFSEKLTKVGGYAFVNGWGTDATPLAIANSSDMHVRVPGNMRPHGVCVHPSPTLRVAAGWRSPVTATVRIEANVAVAHPECTNGVTWAIELRRGTTRQQLSAGVANQAQEGKSTIESVAVRVGDVVSLFVGPRDGNHACDLTAIDLKLSTGGNGAGSDTNTEKVWDLGQDVSGDVLAANPHADCFGNAGVWHFYSELQGAGANDAVIPADSLLAKWQVAGDSQERSRLAGEVQRLFASGPPVDAKSPDAVLYRQLNSVGGPLLMNAGQLDELQVFADESSAPVKSSNNKPFGLEPSLFGKSPSGDAIDAASLCVQAPATITIRLPAILAAGCELVATGALDERSGMEGTAQVRMVAGEVDAGAGLQLSEATVKQANAQWTDDNRQVTSASPILVSEKSEARKRVEAQLDEFRQLFPAALCYTKIVPVDEVVTLVLFHREDEHLQRLMLDDAQVAHLNRLWDELRYVSQDALKQVDVLEQVLEYASQDADPKVFEPMRGPIAERAAAFRQRLAESEPKHLDSIVDFAARAYRRPLTEEESHGLRALYASLRQEEISHDDAIRLTLARILVAPAFLYRAEQPSPGAESQPVSDWELAVRLSYFLWSSQPDEELRRLAAEGRLHQPDTLQEQTRRMLRDPKTQRLATEFACQWLHIYEFDELDEKSDRHFPTFVEMRGRMYQESIQFFTHLFTGNESILDILDADYTYLNEELAKHYGIPGVSGNEWRRVDDVKKFSRGGVLAQATTLAKQSGASRTSPILRGTWISEVVLGEKLPKPPKGVPPLPDDEAATDELTVRQLVEKHVSDPKCAVCHAKIDPYGFALENFDAIGRHREKDLAGRPIDAKSQMSDGTPLDGFSGLRSYLVNERRGAFLRQFCRKLLGYALGRAVQLSDEPLLTEIQAQLSANDDRVATAVETIVGSPQFREIRGRDAAVEE